MFASRCLEVDDVKSVLIKLLSKTKRTLYITFKVGGSFVDKEILEIIERDTEPKADFVYLVRGLGSKIYFKGFSRNILSSILYKSLCL